MEAITLNIPKEVTFTAVGGTQHLIIQNPTSQKVAVKIKTNNKDALHIQPIHDYVQPHSKKDFLVKLVQYHLGVKLQINYTKATEQLIASKDLKLQNIDKKDIKKQITKINVDKINNISQQKVEKPASQVNDSFISGPPSKILNKSQPTKVIQKPASLSGSIKGKQSQKLVVVLQRNEEDQEEQIEQKTKKLKEELTDIEQKIQSKKKNLMTMKQQLAEKSNSSSFIPFYALLALMMIAYLLGSLAKRLIF